MLLEGNFVFQEMLKEKAVAPFSKWEKELPKIIFDPRFKVWNTSQHRCLSMHGTSTLVFGLPGAGEDLSLSMK
jgi:hypothetical protein